MKYTLIVLFVIILIGFVGFSVVKNFRSQVSQTEIQDQPVLEENQVNNMEAPKISIDKNKKYSAVLHTEKGDITIELTADKTPITVNNFVTLAKKEFYNNTIFHRVIKGFMIQGGDPKGDGTGGPGYTVTEKPTDDTNYSRGIIAMAKKMNEPPGTQGSQFFIMHSDNPMPKDYVSFGKVSSGMDVVDAIAESPVQPSGEMSTPVTPVKVLTIDIEEK